NRHIGEHAVGIAHDVDVVGDRTGVESLQKSKWRLPIKDLGLPDIFQGEPDLSTVRRGGNIGTEWARLLDFADDLMVGDGDDGGVWRERRADIAVFAVWREDRHARAVRNDDPRRASATPWRCAWRRRARASPSGIRKLTAPSKPRVCAEEKVRSRWPGASAWPGPTRSNPQWWRSSGNGGGRMASSTMPEFFRARVRSTWSSRNGSACCESI